MSGGGLISKLFGAWRQGGSESVERLRTAAEISYEEARELARHKDPEVRKALASRRDLRPEILYYLAEDPHPGVRREIAANQATPVQADLRLAADHDPVVRGDLAAKIARLAPGLSDDERDRLRSMTYEALALLARDQITRVRQILAETLKDVANAPPGVIRSLAHDSALEVSLPVLEFSPVLSDEDLVEIIQSHPTTGKLTAISRRSSVAADVAEAIAQTEDIDAIAVLLANPSAQIREETLDMLLERAPDVEQWHAPLVRRPQLSARAATRLARFVAESLLQVLQERGDMDPETKAAVAAVVRRRVEDGGAEMADFRRGEQDQPAAAPEDDRDDKIMATVQRMRDEGKLDEAALFAAIATGDDEFVICALASLSGMPLDVVRKIFSSKSSKGTVSLIWKAGLGMNIAGIAQTKVAKISPSDVLRGSHGTAQFPLTEEEMKWQLDFFATMANSAKTGKA